jgi:hypothetical protein
LTFTAATDCYLVALSESVVHTLLNECESFSRHIFRSMYSRISAYDTFILSSTLVAGFLKRLNLSASGIRTGSGDLRRQIG